MSEGSCSITEVKAIKNGLGGLSFSFLLFVLKALLGFFPLSSQSTHLSLLLTLLSLLAASMF